MGLIDKKALQLARLAREELERGEAASEICLDSLITLLATHLLRAHSSLRQQSAQLHAGGLSPVKWRLVSEYIEENLVSRMSLRELAELAGVSPSHFLRAFRNTTGQPPHQYIVGRRLSLAERLIQSSDLPLAAVAVLAGFASNSHMTSTMRRQRGYTPRDLPRGAE